MSNAQNTTQREAVLLITRIEEIETAAAALAKHLDLLVELAGSRAAALRLLGRRTYAVVILDQMLADCDPEGADLIWQSAGLSVPVQFSFALATGSRLEREVRAALARREREQELASSAAVARLDAELKNAVTGFLLESELALAEDGVPPRLQARLRTLAEIAARLRQHLSPASPTAPMVALPPPES